MPASAAAADSGRLVGHTDAGQARDRELMSQQADKERPCLHCLMVDLIDNFFAQYPAMSEGSDAVDTAEADEVIVAVAKTVAELTCRQDGTIRQQLIEQLMREIINYDAEFRREDASGAIGPHTRH